MLPKKNIYDKIIQEKVGDNMLIKDALAKGTIMLKGENLDSPKMKARLLLQDVLDKPRQYLIVHDMETITKEQSSQSSCAHI